MRLLSALTVLVLCVIAAQCTPTVDRKPFNQNNCPESCLLNKNEGSDCQSETRRWGKVRWHYNQEKGICEVFNYKGCNGNKNRFTTSQRCFQKCLGCRYTLSSPGAGQPTCSCKEIDYVCRVSVRPQRSGYKCLCSHDSQWNCIGKAIQNTPPAQGERNSELTRMIGRQSNQNIMAYQQSIRQGIGYGVSFRTLSQNQPAVCTPSLAPCDPTYPYRKVNGTCNNIQNPLWGSILQPFRRVLPAGYADGMGEPRGGLVNSTLPNARLVSSTVHNDLILPQQTITNMVAQVGQFLDHDMTVAPEGNKPCCSGIMDADCWNIKVFDNDTFYSQLKPSTTCLELTRSTPYCFPTETMVREQMNMLTGFVDGSQIYGFDSEREFLIREFSKGRMRVNKDNPNLLPTVKQVEDITGQAIEFMGVFLAGDNRVNEMPALTTMHTLMIREHNRIANEIYTRRPSWSDETVYQEARRLVVAQWQNIVYGAYLPVILGPTSMEKYKISLPTNTAEYSTYDPNVNPTIIHAFATAAYRFGHTLINGVIQLVQGLSVVGSYRVRDNYFNSGPITQQTPQGTGYDLILGGLIIQKSQTYDEHVTEDLSNFLQTDVASALNDLIARNLQRGRDHGIRGYGEYRKLCGLTPLTNSWSDIPKEVRPEAWNKLSSLYTSPMDIDLFTGGLCEFPISDGVSGATFNCIKSLQFSTLKDGDRFFFTHSAQPRPFTPAQLTMLRSRNLGDIICDNSQVQATPKNVFRPFDDGSNKRLMCSDPSRTGLTIMEELVPPRGIKLVHEASGLCLTVQDGSASDGAAINLYHCSSPLAGNQRWDILWADRDQGKDKLATKITVRHSSKCFEANGSSQAINQWTCNGGHNQEWTVLEESDVYGSFHMKNVLFGTCLHVEDDMPGNGSKVVLKDCTNGSETHQLFKSFAAI